MDAITRIIKARVTQGTLLVAAGYWVIAALVPAPILTEILDGLLIASGFLLLAVYLPIASLELMNHRLDRTGRLLLGIAAAWVCTIVLRGLAVYGRAFGRVTWFIESPFFGFFLWGMIWAAALHISAPYADDATRRLPYGRWTIFTLVMGGLIAGFFLGVQAHWWFGQEAVIKPMTG